MTTTETATGAETKGATPGDVKTDNEPAKEESILLAPFTTQVSVARNHPLSYYVDRARRILRYTDTVTIRGRGPSAPNACTLVEILKRTQIATIKKVSTAMETNAYFVKGQAHWSPPAATIIFELGQGELSGYVADYQQRKVIDIFECQKSVVAGKLPITTNAAGDLLVKNVEGKEDKSLVDVFKADEQLQANAKAFLDGLAASEIDLPDFIKYCSKLIHPLLKDRVFKSQIMTELGIDAAAKTLGDAEDNVNDYVQDDNAHAVSGEDVADDDVQDVN